MAKSVRSVGNITRLNVPAAQAYRVAARALSTLGGDLIVIGLSGKINWNSSGVGS